MVTNDAFVDQYVVPLNIRVAGYVREVRFTEHRFVREGDTLLILDDREYRIRVKEAEAALLDARGTQGVIHSGIETSRTNVAVQEAPASPKRAKLWQTEQDFRRFERLLRDESVPGQQYEQAKAAYEAAEARYRALVAQKEAARSQYAEASRRTVGAEANILRREADLDMARLNLSYTVLTAPYDGYIGRRTLEPGQFISGRTDVSYSAQPGRSHHFANLRGEVRSRTSTSVKRSSSRWTPSPAAGSGPRDNHFGGDRLRNTIGSRLTARLPCEGAAHPCPHRPRRHFGRGDGSAAGRHDGRNRSPPPMITAAALELPVRRWVPDRLAVAGLFSVLLPVTMLNGSYTGSMLEVSNTLGSNAGRYHDGLLCRFGRHGHRLPHRAEGPGAVSPKYCCWRT